MLRVGTLCFAIERGLGYLAKSFYDAGVVTDVAVLCHGSIPDQMQWYPDALHITTKPWLNQELKALVRSVDVMLFFETAFEWKIIDYARSHNVKTVLMPMYECTPDPLPYVPDLFLCPSLLDTSYYPDNSVALPVPVDERDIKLWKLRTRAHTFVHNSGHIGLQNRSGTREVVKAVRYLESQANIIIRSQTKEIRRFSKVINSTVPYEELRKDCDVCLAPERFNGLSLPLQESYAQGLLVMTTDRYPTNKWLSSDPLIPVAHYETIKAHNRARQIEAAVVDPKTIAKTIDAWYDRDITKYSLQGKQWASENTWDILKPKYIEELAK